MTKKKNQNQEQQRNEQSQQKTKNLIKHKTITKQIYEKDLTKKRIPLKINKNNPKLQLLKYRKKIGKYVVIECNLQDNLQILQKIRYKYMRAMKKLQENPKFKTMILLITKKVLQLNEISDAFKNLSYDVYKLAPGDETYDLMKQYQLLKQDGIIPRNIAYLLFKRIQINSKIYQDLISRSKLSKNFISGFIQQLQPFINQKNYGVYLDFPTKKLLPKSIIILDINGALMLINIYGITEKRQKSQVIIWNNMVNSLAVIDKLVQINKTYFGQYCSNVKIQFREINIKIKCYVRLVIIEMMIILGKMNINLKKKHLEILKDLFCKKT